VPSYGVKCPNCKRPAEQDMATGEVRCPYCGHRESRNPQPWREDARTMDAQRARLLRRRMRRP